MQGRHAHLSNIMIIPSITSPSLSTFPSSRVAFPRAITAALRCATTTTAFPPQPTTAWPPRPSATVHQPLSPLSPSGIHSRVSPTFSFMKDGANFRCRYHSTVMAAQSIGRKHSQYENERSYKNLSEEEIEELIKVCKFIKGDLFWFGHQEIVLLILSYWASEFQAKICVLY